MSRRAAIVFDTVHGLMQMLDGNRPIAVRSEMAGDRRHPEKHVRIIRKLIPIRDAVREVLKRQESRPAVEGRAGEAAHRLVELRAATSARSIYTTVSLTEDEETGEVRETHRRPNFQPFLDDPDCWLVASIEDYDLETDTASWVRSSPSG